MQSYHFSKLFLKLASDEDFLSNEELFEKYLSEDEEISYSELVYLSKQLNIKLNAAVQHGEKPWGIWFIYNNKKYIVDFEKEQPNSDNIAKSPKLKDKFLDHLLFKQNYNDYLNLDTIDFNKQFWQYPQKLYHATPNKNLKSIIKHGLKAVSESRGLSNRSIGNAVFSSLNPDVIDAYGDTIFEINSQLMKSNGFMPYVSQEPEIEENQYISSIMHMIDEEYNFDIESGMDYETVIIHDNIPSKYIKQITQ